MLNAVHTPGNQQVKEGGAKTIKRWIGIVLILAVAVFIVLLFLDKKKYEPYDWGDYNVLQQAPRPDRPTYDGKQISYDEYQRWVSLGEEWFRGETFGDERVWTDIVGLLNGNIDVPDAHQAKVVAGPLTFVDVSSAESGGSTGWRSEPVFKYVLQAIDDLDGVRGNLYTGNGDAYTSDLVITVPPGSRLDKTFPIPEKLHTGLDVEAGSPWPIGIVPVRAPQQEESLPYLLDPNVYANGPQGVGPLPGGGKFRIGISCALCHYSLDIDWDGKPDLKSAWSYKPTANSPYEPKHAWAIGNQDISLGWIFALSRNTIAGFESCGPVGGSSPDDARRWAEWVRDNYRTNSEETKREVDRGLLLFPRGYTDDTPDGLHNPLQFPSLFTHRNWPYNYDGVMLNASDRNNNVWTIAFDLSQLVALCRDRAGKTAKLAFWEQPGMYSVLDAKDYAEIVIYHSPAVKHDPSQFARLRDDILGVSDGIPGLLRDDSVVLIKGVPGAIPKEVWDFEDNEKYKRTRTADQFGSDGRNRGPMIGLVGTRVVTPPDIREKYNVGELESRYGLNGDEFITEAVSMMLDWVEPPPNLSPLLAKARGLVSKGYEVFKNEGCAKCHSGPFFTNNKIIPLKEIGTDSARALATAPLQAVLAPPYDPKTGKAVSRGVYGIISKLFSGEEAGYKVVTLRYLWGSAPYLHDGGVAVTLRPQGQPAGDDLQALLKRPDSDKVYGVAQILAIRDAHPETYLRANAALSLQAVLLKSERDKVIAANSEPVYPVPGRPDHIPIASIHIQGMGHKYWIQDEPGGDKITALVAFLLALDNDPSQHRQ